MITSLLLVSGKVDGSVVTCAVEERREFIGTTGLALQINRAATD